MSAESDLVARVALIGSLNPELLPHRRSWPSRLKVAVESMQGLLVIEG